MTPLPIGPEAKVLPFRRRQGAVRIRRRSLLARLAAPFAQAVLVVGAPAALLCWVLASPSFALAEVQIDGLGHVAPQWVDRALAPLRGRNLPRLELGEVTGRLAANPWVEAVTVEKRLPRSLRVALVEKRPAALLRRGHELFYLDTAGGVIAPYDPADGAADLLLISVAAGAERELPHAFAFAGELAVSAPAISAGLSEIAVLGDGDFQVFSAALPFPVLLRRGPLAERMALLAEWLPELRRRYPKLDAVDLRFPRRMILVPGEAPPSAAPDDRKVRSARWQSPSSTS